MKKKRLLSCVLIVALLLSLCAIGVGAVTVDDFTDVSPDDWYYDAVSEVAAAGYFNGTTTTTFDPQLTMTRAMFVTVLARFDGATVDNSADTGFADVPTGQYYTGAVAWAAENGLVQGYGGNAFGTSNPITRQDMAVLMTRYIAYYEAKNSVAATTSAKGSETTHDVVDDPADFADAASIAAYATEAVVECANYGLLIGDDNGNFRPTASATRAEAAAVISRLSWTVKETDKVTATGGGGGSSTTYYYLKLDLNGGTLDESVKPYSTDLKTGVLTFRNAEDSFSLSTYSEAASLANYTLAGWNTSADGTGDSYATTKTLTGNATSSTNATILYAQWESNDKIGTGVVTAMEAFGEALLNGISEFKGTTIAESASKTTYGAVGSVDYSAKIVGSSWSIGDLDGPDYGNKTRTVTQDLTVETGDAGSLNEITAFAIEVAKYIVVDGALSNAMLNDVIAGVVDGVENATGLDISANKSVLTASIKDALHKQGGSFWTTSGIGAYVDAATVTMDLYTGELKLDVENGAVSLNTENGTLTDQLTNCAIALAAQMFDDLQHKLDTTPQDYITVSPRFTVEFTLNNENKDALSAFATKYEVVSNVTFNSNDTVLFSKSSNIEFSIALNMVNGTLSSKYQKGFERLLKSNRLNNLLSGYVANIIETESNSVISALNGILAMAEGDSSAVSSAVTDAVTEWFVTNATSGSTEMDNSAIYSLVDTLAEATIESSVDISTTLTDNGVSEDDAAVITDYVNAYQKKVAETGTSLTADEIAEIKASVTDPTTGDNVDDVIDRLIEEYLGSNDSGSVIAAMMVDADEFSAPVMLDGTEIDVATIMNTLNKLATVETMQSVTVSELVDILNSGLFDAYDGTVKTMVGRLSTAIDNLTAMLPATVGNKVTVNSIKINETVVKNDDADKLANVDTVSKVADLLNTVATDYERANNTALTVGDLKVVVNLTVASGNYTVTLNVNYDNITRNIYNEIIAGE
ncbi:MAG: S-layer homology domain-containing protein [Oscillospiraceae bacterium]|nr:S-layer homology domain-containing protein [Oscillospiraceae bacterium]